MTLIRIKEANGSTVEFTGGELIMIGGGKPNNTSERELAAESGMSRDWLYMVRWRARNGDQVDLLMTREERDELFADWEMGKS